MSEQAISIKPSATPTKARVASSGEFARMIASFRGRHIVVDAPAYANGPGEAASPPELLLSAIGGCALGMFDLVCARDGIPIPKCSVDIQSEFGSQGQNETGVSVYDKIMLKFIFVGISSEQAQALINIFHSNCPIYGSVKMASREVITEFEVR